MLLLPRHGPPGLRPGGPGSACGPAGECGMSSLHDGSAPCMWEWFVDLVSSVTTCCCYLDTGRRACGRGVRARPAALQASAACLLCMTAVRPACGSGLLTSSRPSRRAAATSTRAAGPAAGGSGALQASAAFFPPCLAAACFSHFRCLRSGLSCKLSTCPANTISLLFVLRWYKRATDRATVCGRCSGKCHRSTSFKFMNLNRTLTTSTFFKLW